MKRRRESSGAEELTQGKVWSRGDKIALATFVVAVVAFVVSMFIPEVRFRLGLEKRPPVVVNTPVSTPPVAPVAPSQPAPRTVVKGNGNVAGNNVNGNGNIIGNNNHVTQQLQHWDDVTAEVGRGGPAVPNVGNITQGPGSITQIGGTGNQAIIGVVPSPPRTLSDAQVDKLKAAISKFPPQMIFILYSQNDGEAYGLAKQIGDALSSAGWTLKHPVSPAEIMTEGGPPLRGIQVGWHGDALPPHTPVTLDPNTAWGALSRELMHDFPDNFQVQPSQGTDSNLITLMICPNPKLHP